MSLEIKEGLDRLTLQSDEKRRQDLAEWLAPGYFSRQHSDLMSKVENGTGQWVLESEEYVKWRLGASNTLLCHGIPGAGKTMVASIIIKDLWKTARGSNQQLIAFVYCSYTRQEETVALLMSEILRQLIQESQVLPDDLQSTLQQHTKQNTRPSVKELHGCILLLIKASAKVFIVIDALDECLGTSGIRDSLLSELFSLQSQSGNTLYLLATTRPNPEILVQFEDHTLLEIKASDHDMMIYLDVHMSQEVPCTAQNQDLQQEVTQKIIEAADGMSVSPI